ncbi:MAG: isochorismatase family protein [Christensenella sp.]|nr:isochorismatase family protein [Christensenella sp.]
MRIQADNTAAIGIDFQERLVPVIAGNEKIVEKTAMLLKGLRALGVPLVMMRQYPKGLGDIIPEIKEAAGDFAPMDKLSFSACGEEEIMREIESKGKKNVIVCGVEAHVCVLQTVIDLIAAGMQPVLVCDCIGSRFPSDMEIAVQRAQQEGALLTTAEAILFELTQRAGNETFKTISKLVK